MTDKYNTRFIVDIQRLLPDKYDEPMGAEDIHQSIVRDWGMDDPKDVQVKQANTWNDMDTLPKEDSVSLLILADDQTQLIVHWSDNNQKYYASTSIKRNYNFSDDYLMGNCLAWAYAPDIPHKYRKQS